MTYSAGLLRERVTLQMRIGEVDTRGQDVDEWDDVADVWAAVDPLRGRELFAASQVQAETVVRITIRHRTDIGPAWRVMHRDVAYGIVSIIDVHMQRETLELMCSAGVRDGR